MFFTSNACQKKSFTLYSPKLILGGTLINFVFEYMAIIRDAIFGNKS